MMHTLALIVQSPPSRPPVPPRDPAWPGAGGDGSTFARAFLGAVLTDASAEIPADPTGTEPPVPEPAPLLAPVAEAGFPIPAIWLMTPPAEPELPRTTDAAGTEPPADRLSAPCSAEAVPAPAPPAVIVAPPDALTANAGAILPGKPDLSTPGLRIAAPPADPIAHPARPTMHPDRASPPAIPAETAIPAATEPEPDTAALPPMPTDATGPASARAGVSVWQGLMQPEKELHMPQPGGRAMFFPAYVKAALVPMAALAQMPIKPMASPPDPASLPEAAAPPAPATVHASTVEISPVPNPGTQAPPASLAPSMQPVAPGAGTGPNPERAAPLVPPVRTIALDPEPRPQPETPRAEAGTTTATRADPAPVAQRKAEPGRKSLGGPDATAPAPGTMAAPDTTPKDHRPAPTGPAKPMEHRAPAVLAGQVPEPPRIDLGPGVPDALPPTQLSSFSPAPSTNLPALPSLSVPPHLPHLPHLAAEIVQTLAGGAPGTTEIALSPEELGHVRLTIQPHDSDPTRVVVMMSFERPEVMDLFRRHADQLLADIRSSGFSGAELGFAQSDPGGRRQPSSDPSPDPVEPTATRPAGPHATPTTHRVSTSALDLRL